MKNVIKMQLKRGVWRPEEDSVLKNYVQTHGEGNWASVSKKLGLMRGGKSCRLRWKNYLRPNIKRGDMSEEEKDLIIRMHKLLGNRWSLIAGRLPGRTDNEVKNYWNTHLGNRNAHSSQRNLRGKRNATASSHHHINNKEQGDTNILTSQGRDNGRKEDSDVTVSSTDHLSLGEDLKILSYGDKESSLLINYAALTIDEDPFMQCFDSFLLFGLDFNADTDNMNPARY